MTVVAFAARPHPTANQPKKDLYEVGELTPSMAALAALLIPPIARVVGRRASHAINLTLGGLGLLSFPFIKDPTLLLVSMIGVGFAWSSILSVPYSILSGALPARKMGVYMGIFNFFIVIPQLLAATVLGLLLKTFFGGQAIFALVLGAGAFFIAAINCTRAGKVTWALARATMIFPVSSGWRKESSTVR